MNGGQVCIVRQTREGGVQLDTRALVVQFTNLTTDVAKQQKRPFLGKYYFRAKTKQFYFTL